MAWLPRLARKPSPHKTRIITQVTVTDFGRAGALIWAWQNGQAILTNQRLLPQFGQFIGVSRVPSTVIDAEIQPRASDVPQPETARIPGKINANPRNWFLAALFAKIAQFRLGFLSNSKKHNR